MPALTAPPARCAVIGAGISGAAFARHARAAGLSVTLFDKGRSPGGRLSTREAGGALFDIGSPWVDTRAGAWREALLSLPGMEGVALTSSAQWRVGGPGAPAAFRERGAWAPAGGMRALVASALEGVHLLSSKKVEHLEREADEWWLMGEGYENRERAWGPFDWVVLAIPGPQAARLLFAHAPEWGRAALKARYEPQWAACVVFERPLSVDFDIYLGGAGEALAVCKRGELLAASAEGDSEARRGDPWVLQSTPAWAQSRLELPKEMVAEMLLAEWERAVGPLPPRLLTQGHRWRYARVSAPAAAPLAPASLPLLDPELRLGVCGDWRSGPSAGEAYLGGVALARLLAEHLKGA